MAIIETFRRVIDPTDCDMLGHMNISRYFGCVSDAGLGLMTAFGLGHDQLTGGRRQAFAMVHSDATYHREVLAGEWVYMRSGVSEIGRRPATFQHWMYRGTDDELLFDVSAKCVLMDLKARKATVIDDDLKTQMQTFLVEG